MTGRENAVLTVGRNKESSAAQEALEKAGIDVRVVGVTDDIPVLYSSLGVFSGLDAIVWFTNVMTERRRSSWAVLG